MPPLPTHNTPIVSPRNAAAVSLGPSAPLAFVSLQESSGLRAPLAFGLQLARAVGTSKPFPFRHLLQEKSIVLLESDCDSSRLLGPSYSLRFGQWCAFPSWKVAQMFGDCEMLKRAGGIPSPATPTGCRGTRRQRVTSDSSEL